MNKPIQTVIAIVIIFGLNGQLINGQFDTFLSAETDGLIESEKNFSAIQSNSESISGTEDHTLNPNFNNHAELKKSDKVQANSKQNQVELGNALLRSFTSSDKEEDEKLENWMLNPGEWLSK